MNFTVEAFAGSLSICGEPDDMPMRTGIQTADIVAALFAAYSALTGIVSVLRNKGGHTFDVSLSESTIAAAVWETAEYLTTGHCAPNGSGTATACTHRPNSFRRATIAISRSAPLPMNTSNG